MLIDYKNNNNKWFLASQQTDMALIPGLGDR
jgi:hypothetical protein